MLGVCCTPSSDGADPCAELALQPLPLYSLPSDGVTMCTVLATPRGRIFLGGADGHLYELLYAASDTWRQRRCSKVRETACIEASNDC